ncbi:MAG: ABC transporter substrate-binding protein/permease [Coriobacteriales bacterium]|nr:ABC transporter substrate-binding protein/permease [Coriobacteriales bacterium]
MNRATKSKPLFLAVVLAIVLGVAALARPALASAQESADTDNEAQPEYTTLKQLEGKRLAAPTGSTMDLTVKSKMEEDPDFSYFTTFTDMVGALTSGKVDGFLCDEPAGRLLVARNTGIALLPEPVVEDNYGFALPKGSSHTRELNQVINKFRADGTLDELKQLWCGADESAKVVPEQDWDAPKGTLVVAVDSTNEPMGYIRDGKLAGYTVNLILLCAKELGYKLDLQDMSFDAMIASVQTGKADIACSSISITEEKRQSMDLTDSMYDGAITVVVREKGGGQANVGFFEGIAQSFTRTFLVEARWTIVVQGLGVTMLIAVSSGVLGTLLGYVAMRWRNTGSRVASKVINFCEILLGRLPIVVVLMVFYYVVFGALNIPGIAVAIIVFTLSFGSGAEAVMWNAVSAVDTGQREASLALGFTPSETFRDVVFPQAARRFLPLLQGNFITLVKETSVVGFIAVTDLTRAGDLIRSRTMEAFFPLLCVAAIYFIACSGLAWVMNLLIKHTDQSTRPRTIKGVQL